MIGAVAGGVACALLLGCFGVSKANEAVRDMAESDLKAAVSDLYKEKVVIETGYGECEFRNSEIFDITYDANAVGDLNILNYRSSTEKLLQVNLQEDWFECVRKRIMSCSDAYYYEESITLDLKLIQTAKEKELDMAKLEKDLQASAVLNMEDYLSFDPPNNAKVEEDYLDIGKLQDWEIEYDDGLKLGWEDLKDAVMYDKKLKIDSDVFDKLVDKVVESYDTVGTKRSLHTPAGDFEVEGGTYGWKINREKEKEFIKKSIEQREVIEGRTPEFMQKAFGKDYANDVGERYVVVSIEQQHVWYISKGKIIKDSDCVTGGLGKHDTPTGVYAVMEVLPKGKTLKGEGYSTPVNKWIRLTNSGIGLHDASWRRSFGGEIYKWNGSHGCINLPLEFADYLCKKLKTGMPVVVVE